jgi:hypothetical protein
VDDPVALAAADEPVALEDAEAVGAGAGVELDVATPTEVPNIATTSAEEAIH